MWATCHWWSATAASRFIYPDIAGIYVCFYVSLSLFWLTPCWEQPGAKPRTYSSLGHQPERIYEAASSGKWTSFFWMISHMVLCWACMFPRQNRTLPLSAAPSLTCLTDCSSSQFSLLGPARLTSDVLIVFTQILLPLPSLWEASQEL